MANRDKAGDGTPGSGAGSSFSQGTSGSSVDTVTREREEMGSNRDRRGQRRRHSA